MGVKWKGWIGRAALRMDGTGRQRTGQAVSDGNGAVFTVEVRIGMAGYAAIGLEMSEKDRIGWNGGIARN